MKELVLIIRPEHLETLKAILDEVHCGGMTVASAMGCGTQKGSANESVNEVRGFKMSINLLPKMQASVVVRDADVEPILTAVRARCSSGTSPTPCASAPASAATPPCRRGRVGRM